MLGYQHSDSDHKEERETCGSCAKGREREGERVRAAVLVKGSEAKPVLIYVFSSLLHTRNCKWTSSSANVSSLNFTQLEVHYGTSLLLGYPHRTKVHYFRCDSFFSLGCMHGKRIHHKTLKGFFLDCSHYGLQVDFGREREGSVCMTMSPRKRERRGERMGKNPFPNP